MQNDNDKHIQQKYEGTTCNNKFPTNNGVLVDWNIFKK